MAFYETATSSTLSSVLDRESFRYHIYTTGNEDIGDLLIEIAFGDNGGYVIFEQLHIKTGGWWGQIDIHGSYYESYSEDHELQRIDGKVFEDDTVWRTVMRRVDDQLWGVTSVINGLSQQEREQLLGNTLGLTDQFTPGDDEPASLGKLLLADRDKPIKESRFNSEDFVASIDNLPMYWLQQGQQLPKKIRLLDSENLRITEYRVQSNGNHYHFDADGIYPMDLWFAVSKHGIPHFTRLETEDDIGHFVIKIRTLDAEY